MPALSRCQQLFIHHPSIPTLILSCLFLLCGTFLFPSILFREKAFSAGVHTLTALLLLYAALFPPLSSLRRDFLPCIQNAFPPSHHTFWFCHCRGWAMYTLKQCGCVCGVSSPIPCFCACFGSVFGAGCIFYMSTYLAAQEGGAVYPTQIPAPYILPIAPIPDSGGSGFLWHLFQTFAFLCIIKHFFISVIPSVLHLFLAFYAFFKTFCFICFCACVFLCAFIFCHACMALCMTFVREAFPSYSYAF